MFTSQEARKVFQKPNILRRKPKGKRGPQIYNESPEAQSRLAHDKDKLLETNARVTPEYLVLDYETSPIKCMDENSQTYEVNKSSESTHGAITAKVISVATASEVIKPQEANVILADKESKENSTYELYMIKPCSLFEQQDNDSQEEQGSLNIESFLVDSPNKKSPGLSNDSPNLTSMKSETEIENKWCLNFMCDDSKDMVTPNFYDGAQISKVNMDSSAVTFDNDTRPSQAPTVLEQDIIQSCLTSRVVKYKCDVPNCNKSFWTEARLQKHKVIHSRQKPTNLPTTVECPVKKVDSDGVEHACGILFPNKEILMKHLSEDHVPEDAAYRCSRCARRFWWATGMRTHLQSACTVALACSWPGCGRVFRQPCRLREHARAHTGDRPYPCSYPNCNWAFRSASKLVRHARRHTGERRHECAACGRAFPRREHLRDHAARQHARAPRPCTAPGCDQTFSNMSSLYIHMKKMHRPDSKPAAPKKQRTSKKKPSTDLLVMTVDGGASLIKYDATAPVYTPLSDELETAAASAMIIPEAEIVDNDFSAEPEVNEDVEVNEVEEVTEGSFGYDLEGKCARTHCTWPLLRTQQSEQSFAIEEDTQVEQSENSESNIYTVRSDLFLHGNVLINEDSELMRVSSNRAANDVEEATSAGQLDGLDLIDAHPTIDLMQEELMYGDAAVDESSFRVFLMNGEELS